LYLTRILFILIFSIAFFSCKNIAQETVTAKTKIALREVGNQLLIKNQDSTSLILPVISLEPSVYKLEFQETLSFMPIDLVTVIDNSFNFASLQKNYRVEVLQCLDNEVAYSYEINIEEERTIIPCAGRFLPEDCYTIKVTFLDVKTVTKSYLWLYYCIGFMLLFFLLKFKLKKTKPKLVIENLDGSFKTLGVFQFYPEQNKLVKAATEISLSQKECELLAIFAAKPNQIIKREELSKRVWEDKGVFVGRSLDTYISKLRKKLKEDANIKLINVHGVGYKLEVL
jgi:hypothetical protein